MDADVSPQKQYDRFAAVTWLLFTVIWIQLTWMQASKIIFYCPLIQYATKRTMSCFRHLVLVTNNLFHFIKASASHWISLKSNYKAQENLRDFPSKTNEKGLADLLKLASYKFILNLKFRLNSGKLSNKTIHLWCKIIYVSRSPEVRVIWMFLYVTCRSYKKCSSIGY